MTAWASLPLNSRSLLPHRATSHLTAPWKWLLLNQKLPTNYQVQWPLAGSWHSQPLFGPWLLRVSLSPQATFSVHTVVSSQCPIPRLLVSDPRLTSPARSSSPPRLPVPFTPLPDRGARLPSCILGIRCPRNGLISLPLLPPLWPLRYVPSALRARYKPCHSGRIGGGCTSSGPCSSPACKSSRCSLP